MDLMKLACNVEIGDLDASIIDVLLNWYECNSNIQIFDHVTHFPSLYSLQKLPDYDDNTATGELQLIANHIDPILTPLFHQPEHGRALLW
jgi:hypothetical protein